MFVYTTYTRRELASSLPPISRIVEFSYNILLRFAMIRMYLQVKKVYPVCIYLYTHTGKKKQGTRARRFPELEKGGRDASLALPRASQVVEFRTCRVKYRAIGVIGVEVKSSRSMFNRCANRAVSFVEGLRWRFFDPCVNPSHIYAFASRRVVIVASYYSEFEYALMAAFHASVVRRRTAIVCIREFRVSRKSIERKYIICVLISVASDTTKHDTTKRDTTNMIRSEWIAAHKCCRKCRIKVSGDYIIAVMRRRYIVARKVNIERKYKYRECVFFFLVRWIIDNWGFGSDKAEWIGR